MPTDRSAVLRLLAALVLATASGPAAAQSPGERGSVPPGTSRDGSGPAAGAIKGGSIAPDLTQRPARERDVARCQQLAGDLRTQCLRDLDPGAGGTQPPQGASRELPQRDPSEPPPQNPAGPR